MKVAEISGGAVATLRLRSKGKSFQPLLQREVEVVLVRSGNQTLLSCKGDVWAVEGVTSSDTSELIDVVTSGLPSLSYVAQVTTDTLVIEIRRFTQEFQIVEPMQLGLDEKVLEDVRRGHRVGGTVADVAAWLEDRLFIPTSSDGSEELRRLIFSGDARGQLDAFRIHGIKIAADVRRVDDKLRIERVVRGGRGGNSRWMLLSAPISIIDVTLAAAMHGAVRTTLSEVISGNDSYLRTWQEYHKKEQECVLRRARTFGVLEYKGCERRREDGGWRFHLVRIDDLTARLAMLGEWERFELEAGDNPPNLNEEMATTTPRKSPLKTQRLSAAITAVDVHKYTLDLDNADEDDEQPTPPKSGFLFLSTGGDKVRMRRRERAEEALRTGNCPLPQLGLLMEGRPAPAARRGRVSVDSTKLKSAIREVFGASGPTQRQLEAIEIALNTPDVCLIQGPPGTGKTKVITAIERCLAVLADEGAEPSHRILVSAAQHDAVENVAQRTEVFGLPAEKIGRRRRGQDTGFDSAQEFANERIEQLRAKVRVPPEAERLSQARGLVLACVRTKTLPTEQAGRIRDVVRVLGELLPPNLYDKAMERVVALDRPKRLVDPEESLLLIQAARSIRVENGPFSDDGPLQARKALRRLGGVLSSEEQGFLERCADVEPEQAPPWIVEGCRIRDALIDRLTQPLPASEPCYDDDTHRLLLEILDTVDGRIVASRAGDDAALVAYMNELETDPEGVRKALQHYTVVLASTLQHAASNEMRRVRGIDEGQATFESVIVDEAARANPLDLFIPLSMAKRRVVLVGDHRQLPHLLEPDVERQLAEGVEQGTVEDQTLQAVRASLFERMWVVLRALENRDSIQRTVTLNAQYRMHPELGKFVSREFYECHDDGVIESPRKSHEFNHDLPGYSKNGTPCVAAWLDVPKERGGGEKRGISKSRTAEAETIAKEVRLLMDHDSTLTFGVIAFYSAQVNEIGLAMLKTGLTEQTTNKPGWKVADQWARTYNAGGKKVERLRIGTVDAFQGKEFDVVFLSVTRSNDLSSQSDEQQRRKYGHLMLENRLCVAMSRQQRMLVAVGDLAFVKAPEAEIPLRSLNAFAALCGGTHGLVR